MQLHKLHFATYTILLIFSTICQIAENRNNNDDEVDSSEVEVLASTVRTTLPPTNEESGGVTTEDGIGQRLPQQEPGKEGTLVVGVKIDVLEFPGEFIRMFGIRVNYSDAFGDEVPVDEFRGIPFAEPPVKSLRFQRPVLKVPTNGFRAYRDAEPCPQMSMSGGVIGSEQDCLSLNIFAPGNKGSGARLPVLIWFHGESPQRFASRKFSILASGSAQDLQPFVFLQNKIIVVTPQYRLGTLGFLSVANEDLNGNMGMFDQLLALEWVQRFIPSFGGDPNQITVMGHGSSATSLGVLATSEMARGLFHRLILMSGSPMSPVAVDTNQKLTFAEIALQNACPSFPTLQFVRCMQKRPTDGIIRADEILIKGRHLGKMRSPVAVIQKEDDRRFLPPLIYKEPMEKISQGSFDPVPIIVGVTSAEMNGFLSSLGGKSVETLSPTIFSNTLVLRQFIRAILSRSSFGLDADLVAQLATFEYFSGLNISLRQEQAVELVEEMLSDYLFHMPALSLAKLWTRFAPVHMYVFDYVPTGPDEGSSEDNGENSFGRQRMNPQDANNNEPPNNGGPPPITQAIHGSDLLLLMEGHKGSAQDRDLANVMLESFINFIHKGSPLQSGLEWPAYREDTREYISFGEQILVKSAFRGRQQEFWTELIKDVSERSCPRSKGKVRLGRPSISEENEYRTDPEDHVESASFVLKRSSPQQTRRKQVFEDVSASGISQRFYTIDSSDVK